MLYLDDNALTGSIPSSLGSLSQLKDLQLDDNRLTGPIPAELGDLTSLEDFLLLSGNQLEGPIPPKLANLSQLPNGNLELDYNKLFVDEPVDPALVAFLDTKAPNWQATQTVAPTNVKVSQDGNQVAVSWTPIAYTGDSGAYEILSSTAPGGSYDVFGSTANKTTSNQVVSVSGNGPHFFVVRTRTDPHDSNQNTLTSGETAEANSQCSEPLQTMQISGAAGIVLSSETVDTPDAQNGFMTLCYDPMNDCYIVPGNQGLQAGLTFTALQQSGGIAASATDFCGNQQSARPEKEFQVNLSSSNPRKQGANLSLNCLSVDISNGDSTFDSSSGCLVDNNGDNSFESVSVTVPNTTTSVLMDCRFTQMQLILLMCEC